MNIDDAVCQVFKDDILGVQDRMPDPDVVARVLSNNLDQSRNPFQRAMQDFLPAAVLAAACLVVVASGPPGSGFARPLASELERTLPEDAGEHFVTFMVSAGDSLRSVDP